MKPGELHLVIHASAGAGKTYQLVGRYVALLLDGADVSSILATTFTKKAAGEILQRVLTTLAHATLDAAGRDRLASQAQCTAVSREEATAALTRLVRSLHRAQITTLDAFFRRVVSAFALELGLPSTWRLLDEVDEGTLRAAALSQALESHRNLLTLVRALEQGQATRAVHPRLDLTVAHLHELYVETSPAAWRWQPRLDPLSDDALEAALDDLQGSPPTGRPALVGAWRKDLSRARQRRWSELLSGGVARAVALGHETYRNTRLPERLTSAYRPVVEHARALLLSRLADRTEATWELLRDYDSALQVTKLRRAALAFGDLARVLDAARTLDAEAELFYRLDARVRHLLLDEFQDTSRAQWRVLFPLIEETVATSDGSRSFFCVGDVKQAIYGWRGAEPSLLATLSTALPGLAERPLHRSWRASTAVLEFVNRVFGTLGENPALHADHGAARRWSARFHAHETVHADRRGAVTVRTGERGEDRATQTLRTLEEAAELTRELVSTRPGSVGALLRTRDAVARMRYELSARGIDSSEEGGTPLTDAPATQVVLSALTLADHPGDGVAYFHLRHSPLWPTLASERTASASALAASLRRALAEHGYGRTVSRWATALGPACDARNRERLRQLVELAYAFDRAGALRADAFVHRVRHQRVEDPTAARVRVMTIHQAKGLEFDLVVLPQLSVPLARVDTAVLVDRDDPAEPPSRVVCGASRVARDVSSAMAALYEQERGRAIEESSSLLYVAITRAAHELHLVIDPSAPGEKSHPPTMAGLVRGAVDGEEHTLAPPNTVIFSSEEAPRSRRAQSGAGPSG